MIKKTPALPSEIATVPAHPEYRVLHRYSPKPRYTPRPVGESRTIQAAKDECDINRIAQRLYSGLDPGVPLRNGFYRDNTLGTEMKDTLDVIRRHHSAFNELPLEIRSKYSGPSEYYNAAFQDLEKRIGNSNPLDVTVPTDSNAVRNHQGDQNETQTDGTSTGQKDVQKSNKGASQKRDTSTN